MDEKEPFSVFPWCEEVSFHVSDLLSVVDFPRSFVNHPFVRNTGMALLWPALFSRELPSVRLDAAAMDTPYEGANGHTRYVRKSGMIPLYTLCDVLWRLVIEEVRFNDLSEFRMLDDRVGTYPLVVLCNLRFVLSIGTIVALAFSRFGGQFIRYRSLRYADPLGNLLLCVSFAYEDVNLMTVAFREPLFLCFFIGTS